MCKLEIQRVREDSPGDKIEKRGWYGIGWGEIEGT